MKKILLPILLAFCLTGCAELQKLDNAFSVATAATLSPRAVFIARNSFDAIEASTTNYLNLTRCDKTTSKVCRDKAVTAILIPALENARTARNNLKTFQKNHPGQLGTQGLYDALQLSLTTLTGIMSTYNIGVVQ